MLGQGRSRDLDPVILLAALGLAVIGLVAVYSAGQTADAEMGAALVRSQALKLALGLAALLLAVFVPFRLYESLAYLLYPSALILLLSVQLLGGDNPRGDRWISLGPLNFEPSELAKLAVIFALARYLSGKRGQPRSLASLTVPFIIVLVPMVMVARQPDLGTAIVLGGVFLPMVYWAGLRRLYLVLLLSPLVGLLLATEPESAEDADIRGAIINWSIFFVCVVGIIYLGRLPVGESAFLLLLNIGLGIGAPWFWGSLADYQRKRILTFLNPESDSLGAGYQILQSKVALGSGGLVGKGYLAGTQKALSFLPAQHTDFIFSVWGEEFGFLGAALVLVLYFGLVIRGLTLAGQARNKFAALLAVGISCSLAIHATVNVGMTMGLLPVTGLPLPLLSYGGSSLVTTLAAAGILLHVGMRRREY